MFGDSECNFKLNDFNAEGHIALGELFTLAFNIPIWATGSHRYYESEEKFNNILFFCMAPAIYFLNSMRRLDPPKDKDGQAQTMEFNSLRERIGYSLAVNGIILLKVGYSIVALIPLYLIGATLGLTLSTLRDITHSLWSLGKSITRILCFCRCENYFPKHRHRPLRRILALSGTCLGAIFVLTETSAGSLFTISAKFMVGHILIGLSATLKFLGFGSFTVFFSPTAVLVLGTFFAVIALTGIGKSIGTVLDKQLGFYKEKPLKQIKKPDKPADERIVHKQTSKSNKAANKRGSTSQPMRRRSKVQMVLTEPDSPPHYRAPQASALPPSDRRSTSSLSTVPEAQEHEQKQGLQQYLQYSSAATGVGSQPGTPPPPETPPSPPSLGEIQTQSSPTVSGLYAQSALQRQDSPVKEAYIPPGAQDPLPPLPPFPGGNPS